MRVAWLLVASVLLAGCAQKEAPLSPAATEGAPLDPLTEDVFGLGAFVATSFASFDGTRIHVDLQFPDGEGPFPVLVRYTPYSTLPVPGDEAWGTARSAGAQRPHGLVDFYVPKGYAVAIAHVRGSGQSGGCFTTGGPEEAKDGHALVEWLASRPWSNGRVAMMGTSYDGTTPLATAALAPPHLTTIVPVAAVSDWYRYYFENGEPRFFGELPFGLVYGDHPLWMSMGVVPRTREPTHVMSPDQPACARAQAENAWLQDDKNAYWQARDHVPAVRGARAPMLYAHGFLDENTPTSLVTDFYEAYGGEKRLWLQQHGHGVPARFEEYHAAVHRWLDFWMLDRENGALDMPPVTIQDNRGKYRVEADWPPRDAKLHLLHFAPGALVPDVPEDGAIGYTDEPRALAAQGGRLVFESEPYPVGLHLSGAPRVEIVASSDRTDTQWGVQLFDVAPDGTATFVTRGYLDARHRSSLESGEDVVPGEEALYAFVLHGRDHVLAKGHALRLVLASSDPYVVPDAPGATNTVRLGEQGSRIVLPVVDDAVRTYTDKGWAGP